MTLIYDEPAGQYHQTPAVSFHRLLDFDHRAGGSPVKFYLRHVLGLEREETEAMAIGRAIHVYVLEGKAAFDREYVVAPKGMKFSTKAGREWEEQQTKSIIKHDVFEMMERMERSVRANPEAAAILSHGSAEVTCRHQDAETGMVKQCRFDWLKLEDRSFADLKSCEEVRDFRYDAYKRQYHRQVAWYGRMLAEELRVAWPDPESIKHALVAAEKVVPWSAQVFAFRPETVVAGDSDNQAALKDLEQCYAKDTWPDLTGGVVTI